MVLDSTTNSRLQMRYVLRGHTSGCFLPFSGWALRLLGSSCHCPGAHLAVGRVTSEMRYPPSPQAQHVRRHDHTGSRRGARGAGRGGAGQVPPAPQCTGPAPFSGPASGGLRPFPERPAGEGVRGRRGGACGAAALV